MPASCATTNARQLRDYLASRGAIGIGIGHHDAVVAAEPRLEAVRNFVTASN